MMGWLTTQNINDWMNNHNGYLVPKDLHMEDYLEHFVPAEAKSQEDWMMGWLINDWTNNYKGYLIPKVLYKMSLVTYVSLLSM